MLLNQMHGLHTACLSVFLVLHEVIRTDRQWHVPSLISIVGFAEPDQRALDQIAVALLSGLAIDGDTSRK